MSENFENKHMEETLRKKYESCKKSFEMFKRSLKIRTSIFEKTKSFSENIPCRKCPFYGSQGYTGSGGFTQKIKYFCRKHDYIETAEAGI